MRSIGAAARLSRRRLNLGARSMAWTAPPCDCYTLLRVSPTATSSQIKAAYLERAKSAHPDAGGGSADSMVQLNLCYEALTKHRVAYDASKRTAAGHPSGAYGANRGAWWTGRSPGRQRFEDDLGADFAGMDWEDAFSQWQGMERAREQRQKRTSKPQRRPPKDADWRGFAEAWREEAEATLRELRAEDRRREARYVLSDSDSDSDFEGHGRSKRRRGRRERGKHKSNFATGSESESSRRGASDFEGHRAQREEREAPAELWLSMPGEGRKQRPTSWHWEGLAGAYTQLEAGFNGRPAYSKTGERPRYLFWSKAFGDWKISERLEDDGHCMAFSEDQKGKRAPWAVWLPQWSLWDPSARKFVQRKITVRGSAQDDSESDAESTGAGEGEKPRPDATRDDEEMPWPRPSWHQWSTPALMKWCERRSIDTTGCFDREALLEQVEAFGAASGGAERGARERRTHAPYAEEDASADEDAPPRRRRSRARGDPRRQPRQEVQLASRVKSDGSYTRRPSLDPQVLHFGNRTEPFGGVEEDVLPWLYAHGEKSRLYGVFVDGAFGYSLVWNLKQKYWGRAGHRSGSRPPSRDWIEDSWQF